MTKAATLSTVSTPISKVVIMTNLSYKDIAHEAYVEDGKRSSAGGGLHVLTPEVQMILELDPRGCQRVCEDAAAGILCAPALKTAKDGS